MCAIMDKRICLRNKNTCIRNDRLFFSMVYKNKEKKGPMRHHYRLLYIQNIITKREFRISVVQNYYLTYSDKGSIYLIVLSTY